MAELLGEAYVQVRADMKGLRPDLSKVGTEIRGFFSALQSQLSNILPFASLAGGVAAVVNEFRQAINAAREQADADKRLEQVLIATGHAAGLTAEQLREHASAIQDSVGIADDEINNFQSILLTFRNIQGEVFKDATDKAVAMSIVMGQDLRSSAIQLGKALNDPIKGMTALQRVGVAFTDAQKEQIKAYVKSGEGVKAQKIILAELGKEFGTVATLGKKMASDPQGQLKVLTARISDLREALGAQLIPFQLLASQAQEQFVLALTSTMEMVNKAIHAYQDLDKYLHGYLTTVIAATAGTIAFAAAFPYIIAGATAAFVAVQSLLIGSGWGIPLVALGAIGGALAVIVRWLSTLEPIQQAWTDAVVKAEVAWNNISTAAGVAFKVVSEAVTSLMGIMGLGDLADRWKAMTSGLSDAIVSTVTDMIKSISAFVLDASEWAVVLSKNWDKMWQIILLGGELLVSRMQDIFSNLGPFIIDVWLTTATTIAHIINELPTVFAEVSAYLQSQFGSLGLFITETMQNATTTSIKVFKHLPGALQEIAEYLVTLFNKLAADITNAIVKGAETASRLALVIWENYGKSVINAIAGISSEANKQAIAAASKEAEGAAILAKKALEKADPSKKGGDSHLGAIEKELAAAAERQRMIQDAAAKRAANIPLGKTGITNIAAIAASGLDALKANVEELFAPSEKSKGLAESLSKAMAEGILSVIVGKIGMEAARPDRLTDAAFAREMRARRGLPEDELFKGKKPAGGVGAGKLEFGLGKKTKDKTEGFFGPEELAKKLQEALLQDSKTDKLLEAAEVGVEVEKGMLIALTDINTMFKKNKPITVATA